MNIKQDTRPMRYSWAPGEYLHTCPTCNDHFVGDKRAVLCADCAYALPDTDLVKIDSKAIIPSSTDATLREVNEQLRLELASMVARNGTFFSDATFAAFGHRDALTDEQFIESLKQLRAELEKAQRQNAAMRAMLVYLHDNSLLSIGYENIQRIEKALQPETGKDFIPRQIAEELAECVSLVNESSASDTIGQIHSHDHRWLPKMCDDALAHYREATKGATPWGPPSAPPASSERSA